VFCDFRLRAIFLVFQRAQLSRMQKKKCCFFCFFSSFIYSRSFFFASQMRNLWKLAFDKRSQTPTEKNGVRKRERERERDQKMRCLLLLFLLLLSFFLPFQPFFQLFGRSHVIPCWEHSATFFKTGLGTPHTHTYTTKHHKQQSHSFFVWFFCLGFLRVCVCVWFSDALSALSRSR